MGRLPFNEEQFFAVFAAYNDAVWPAPVLLSLLALGTVALVWRRSSAADRVASGFLALLWAWTGVAYHLAFFSRINPAAYAFGALFLIQGVLFFRRGVIHGDLRFRGRSGGRGALAVGILAYALVVYPLIGIVGGLEYSNGPSFGAPCPVVIYTFGMLVLARELPFRLLVIPLLWALVGSSAVLTFDIWQDIGLLVSATIALGVALHERKRGYRTR